VFQNAKLFILPAIGTNIMKTKFSNRIIILSPILIILLLGLFTFGRLALYKTIEKPEFIGFLVSYMFIWLSLGFIFVLINELRSFKLTMEN